MRIVIGGESLIGELSGIGQYTFNLTRRYLDHSHVEDVKCLVHGRLVTAQSLIAPHLQNEGDSTPANIAEQARFRRLGKLRSIAARNRAIVACYNAVIPHIEKRSFKKYSKGSLLHSPNYLLPDFPGPRVVSIPDLSTFIYPEFHPQERVNIVNSHTLRALKEADHIITISQLVKNQIMERFGVAENRISVTYLGADDKFCPISEKEFALYESKYDLKYKKYFIFLSTIEPRKNLSRLLDAYQIYREESGADALPLVVAGAKGWGSSDLIQKLLTLHHTGSVKYLGYVDQCVLPKLLAGAKALLYPSLYEGFGLPVLEAMQSNTAVLTSKNSSMAEFTDDSVLLANAESEEDIAESIRVLGNDDSLVSGLSGVGLKKSREYSWDRCVDETLEIYQNFLN